MARSFNQLATAITLAASALLVVNASPAAAQQAVSGRMRVLVPAFESAKGGKSKVGEKIAERLKKALNEMPTHAPADDKEVKAAIKKFGLKENEMGCIQWRQLMTHVNAELTLCGTVDEATNQINAVFHSSKSTQFDVPQFALTTDEQAAQQVVLAFRTYTRQLELVVFCNDYIGNQNWQTALDNCNQAVEMNPNSVDAHYMRGSALTNLNRNEEALAAYKRVLELDQLHQEAMLAAGIVAAKLGQQDVSQKYFQEYLALNPGNEDVRLKIASDLGAAGDWPGALKLIEEKLDDKASVSLIQYAGDFAMNAAIAKQQASGPAAAPSEEAAGFFRKAATHYAAVIAKDATKANEPTIMQRLIIAYSNSGENAKALEVGSRATASSNDARIWLAYSTALRQEKRLDESLTALDKVAQIDPNTANINRTRALLLMELGRVQDAIPAIQAAQAKNEFDQNAVEQLSQQMSGIMALKLVQEKKYDEAQPLLNAARAIGKSERSIGMANFIEAFGLIQQGDPIIRSGNSKAIGERAKAIFLRARTLLEGAAGYTDQASNRAQMLQRITQYMLVAETMIKQGR
jgi:tetratricopeptide (TPR) repeat protein